MTQPQEKPLPVELKPCPFCGSKTVYTAPPAMGKGRWVVECDDCRAEGPASSDNSDAGEDEAIAAWNTRPDYRAKCEEAERLLREARTDMAMCVAEMAKARGRIETLATCNEDRRIAAALGSTYDHIHRRWFGKETRIDAFLGENHD